MRHANLRGVRLEADQNRGRSKQARRFRRSEGAPDLHDHNILKFHKIRSGWNGSFQFNRSLERSKEAMEALSLKGITVLKFGTFLHLSSRSTVISLSFSA